MNYSGTNILHYHKELLRSFWAEYGAVGSRKKPSPKPRNTVLKALISLSEVRLYYKSTEDRAGFEKKKHQSKFSGFNYCFACKKTAEVRHHIILLKHGGRNQSKNIVGLCRACHAEIHPWLR